MAVTVSENAAKEIRRIMKEQGLEEKAALRVAVKGGGCSGFTYDLSFDDEKRKYDEEFNEKGVRVLIDLKSYVFVNGCELDFSGGILNRQFLFNNPNAKKSCGCGTSFGV